MRNRRFLAVLGAALVAAGCDMAADGGPGAALAGSGLEALRGGEASGVRKIFEVEQMTGVPRPYAGPTAAENAIRGVVGGGLPWVIRKGEAKLYEDGRFKVEVKGLVFDPNDPVVISRGLAGRNTIPGFKAILSCRTVQLVEGSPVASVANVETAVYPATQGLATEGGGNAEIDELIVPPNPCIAPIVFVTSPTGAWFAASGF